MRFLLNIRLKFFKKESFHRVDLKFLNQDSFAILDYNLDFQIHIQAKINFFFGKIHLAL